MLDILNVIQTAISRVEFCRGESQRAGVHPVQLLLPNKETVHYAVSTDNKEN